MLSGGSGLADGLARLDLAARKTIFIALSGGGDSLALLLLAETHLRRAAPRTRLVAASVDHGLRPESAAEAAQMAEFCAARDIPHLTLRWEGAKPSAGLSAAAREARHRRLAEAARSCGSDLVLTGHTLDDLAETVLMRKGRGPGPGLAGIAPATLFEQEVWFARPLLGVRREALRAFLHGQGVKWIDDPSNEDPAYERVRARREISTNADPEALREALVDEAAEAACRRIALGERAAALITSYVQLTAPGLVRLDRAILDEGDAALYALRLLLACMGGGEHLPERELAAGIFAGLRSWPGRKPFRAAACGAIVDARSSGVFLHREFRGRGPAAIPAADGDVWDGRFRIRIAGDTAEGMVIAPVGKQAAAEAALPESNLPASLVRAALAAEPGVKDAPHPHPLPVSDGEREASPLRPASFSPSLRGEGPAGNEGQSADPRAVALTPLVAPYARYLPSFDLAPARALAALLGAPPIPAPPLVGHNRHELR